MLGQQKVDPKFVDDRSSTDPASDAGNQATNVERLFRTHNSALLRFIAAKIGSHDEAREIAQEAYVHLLQLNRPEAISHLSAFLFKTAANLAVDRLRRRSRRPQVSMGDETDLLVFELSPERQICGEQAISVVWAAIRELPAKCRQAFLLHRIHEIHVQEIAVRMNIGECMVRRYIARALEYIRLRLDVVARADEPNP
jgi:RNA polymerase sigma factor (sigma-70 family)